MDISPAVGIIIIITVIVSVMGFNSESVMEHYSFHVGRIKKGELHRFFSSSLLHGDWGHLFFNMFSFYSFGSYMERGMGSVLFFSAYVLSALGGDLLALFLNRANDNYRAVGASGAVSGIIFMSAMLDPTGGVYVFPIPVAIPSWIFAILFVLISIYALNRGRDTIGHEAHLGGALMGIIIITIIVPDVFLNNPLLWVAITLPVVLLIVVSFVRPDLIKRSYQR